MVKGFPSLQPQLRLIAPLCIAGRGCDLKYWEALGHDGADHQSKSASLDASTSIQHELDGIEGVYHSWHSSPLWFRHLRSDELEVSSTENCLRIGIKAATERSRVTRFTRTQLTPCHMNQAASFGSWLEAFGVQTSQRQANLQAAAAKPFPRPSLIECSTATPVGGC